MVWMDGCGAFFECCGRGCGNCEVRMVVPYYRSSVLLRAIAAVLDLQFQCTATALTFLHKFHSMAPAGTRDQNVRPPCYDFG